MRRLSRSFFVFAVVLSLTTPTFARPAQDPGGWAPFVRVVKVIKSFARTLLDDMSVPHP
jgi:hypothetical protein